MSGLPAGGYKVEFAARNGGGDYVRQYYNDKHSRSEADAVTVEAGETRHEINAVMQVGGQITGTVTSAATKAAIAGIEVCASPEGDEGESEGECAATASNGEYTVSGLATGGYKVEFLGSGNYLAQYYSDKSSFYEADAVAITAGETKHEINAAMQIGGQITGTVTSAATKAAIAGVQVCVYPTGEEFSEQCAPPTSSNGEYTVSGLATGSYKVEFSARNGGGNYVRQYYSEQSARSEAEVVTVEAGETKHEINAAMQIGGQITGTVTSAATKAAIAGVQVCAFTEGGEEECATTNSSGEYIVSGLATGSYKVEFSARNGGGNYLRQYYNGKSSYAEAEGVAVTAGETKHEINAAMLIGGQITGTVTSAATKAAIAGVEVCAFPEEGGEEECAATNSSGEYTLSRLVTGSYKVHFSARNSSGNYAPEYYNGKSSYVEAEGVAVTAGETKPEINAAMKTGGKITGTVTGAATKATIAGIEVCAFPEEGGEGECAATNSGGEYTVSRLATGSYRVEFSARNGGGNYVRQYYSDKSSYAEAEAVAVTAGETKPEIDAAMQTGGKITGKVTSASTKAAIAGIEVCTLQEFERECGITNGKGEYTVLRLATGSYRVEFVGGSYVTQYYNGKASASEAEAVAVTAGETKPEINAAMQPAGQITGTVTSAATKAPLRGIEVTALTLGGIPVASESTNSNGRYTVSGLAGGSYKVEFSGGSYLRQYYSGKFSLAEAEGVPVTGGSFTPGVDAAMYLPSQISGTVTNAATKAPIEHIEVTVLTSTGSFVASALTDASGEYSVSGLAGGSYKVEFSAGEYGGGWATQYYNDKSSQDEADLVSVPPEKTVSEINAAMQIGIPVNTVPPSISGTAQQGKELIEHHGAWENDPTGYKVEWLRCNKAGEECSPITTVSEEKYVPESADVGHTIRVSEVAKNAGGPSKPALSTPTPVVVPPVPVLEALPTITGTAKQGDKLTLHHGKWSNAPTDYEDQWLRCNEAGKECEATGASGETYELTSKDVKHKLRVEEIVRNEGGAGAPATSLATAVVVPAPPVDETLPTITGTAQQGKELTRDHGKWSNEPTGYADIWVRCNVAGKECEPTAGTGESYVPVAKDVGHTLRLEEIAHNEGGPSSPAISEPTAVVLPPAPVDVTLPAITGEAVQGKTLTEYHGTWENNPAGYKIQWLLCGSMGNGCLPIGGATGETYSPTALDLGDTIRVEETASNSGGTSEKAATSEPTAVVKAAVPVNITPPTISGTAEKGQTLVEQHGTWTNEPTSYTYKWERCNAAGKECALISGAENETYQATAADVGHELRVEETAINAGGESLAVPSAPTAAVVPIPLHAVAGESLTAAVGVPVVFDGSGSSPASEIEHYTWEFGDGATSTEKSTTHTYAAPGTYTATLTVSRGTETAHQSTTVTVTAPAPKNVKIKTVGSGGTPIAGATVLYVGSSGARVQATTGTEGEAALEGLPDGTDTVYAYESGYRPLVGAVTVSGGAGSATLTLVSGEVATSTLKSHELDLKEIEAAGINVNDPANQHVYEFEVRLAFTEGAPPATLSGFVNNDGAFVGPNGGGVGGGGWTCSPNECEGGGVVVVPAFIQGHPLIQWLILRGKATVLKQFFEVSMVIQNLSPEPFKLTTGTATLHLPPGISLAPTSKPQLETQNVEDVPGLGSKTVNWIIRGDTPGNYYLSADYHGNLNIIEAPVNLHAELAQPLKVWGAEALSLKVQADEGALAAGIPYGARIGVTNNADVPFYNVALEIDSSVHEHFIFQPDQVFHEVLGELKPGETVYAEPDILVPDGESQSVFNPALSSATFVGQSVKPGEGITAVPRPPLYALTGPVDTPGFTHLHWEPSPGAEGYEVFTTPNLDTPFAAKPDPVLASPTSTEPVEVLPSTATDAYLSGASATANYYAVTTIIAKRATLNHPVIQVSPPQPSTTSDLDGVSCTTATSCTAVGYTEESGVSHAITVPITKGVIGTPQTVPTASNLNGITCTSTASCVAVGKRVTSGVPEGIVVPITQGHVGKPQFVPQVANLAGVTCPSSTVCFAVGKSTGGDGTLVQMNSSATKLTVKTVPNTEALLAVTCSRASKCVAVGRSGHQNGAVISVINGAAQLTQEVPETEVLRGVACAAANSCEAVGTAVGPHNAAAIVLVSHGLYKPVHVFEHAGPEAGLACVNTTACFAVGQNSVLTAGVILNTAGSADEDTGVAALNAISCYHNVNCVAVGQRSDLVHTAATTLTKNNIDANPNNEKNCPAETLATGEFDTAIDEFTPDQVKKHESFQGIRAHIAAARVCRIDTSPLTSSWVMLQSSGGVGFVQAGIFYNPDGTDNPFVEARPTPQNNPPKACEGDTFTDGLILTLNHETTCAIEIFALGKTRSGTFGVETKGLTEGLSTCEWITRAKMAQKYLQFQGEVPSPGHRKEEVEATLNGKCLWVYYLPEQYGPKGADPLTQADLTGGELHGSTAQFPGTYEEPLTFSQVRVHYGHVETWQNFSSTGAGTITNPLPQVAPLLTTLTGPGELGGCRRQLPSSGAGYTLSTWAQNILGACAPWYPGP